MNVIRDPYVDGTLTLNGSGLRFIDTSGKQVFCYLPQDVRRITLGITRMGIKPHSGRRFAVSLNAADTLQEVRDGRAMGYSGIAGAVPGLAVKGASVGVGIGSFADVGRLAKDVDRAAWAKLLKELGYPLTDLSLKKQFIYGAALGIVATAALTVLSLVLRWPLTQ